MRGRAKGDERNAREAHRGTRQGIADGHSSTGKRDLLRHRQLPSVPARAEPSDVTFADIAEDEKRREKLAIVSPREEMMEGSSTI